MFACDFTKLNRELRQSEYEEATALYGQLIAAGYSETKAIAMVYRAGGAYRLCGGQTLANGIPPVETFRAKQPTRGD